jgi:2-dehydro-3-deoxy-D-pentonate aldolase
MAAPIFQGNVSPIPTIWTDEGKFDSAGMSRMVDFVVKGGADAIFCCGSAGEFSQMNAAQRREVASFVVSQVNKRIKVLVGITSCSTDEAIEYGRHAKSIGADGVVAVNPYYALLLPENIMNHFRRIAENVDLPILLYNFPTLTGQDISPQMVKELALAYPNIVGIKDTVDTIRHIRDVIHAVKPVRPDFAVFAGFDEYMLETLIMGGDGGFPSSLNFAPYIPVGILKAFREKDAASLFRLQHLLAYIPPMFSLESPFYAVVKEAAKMVGVDISTYVLPPAAALSEEKRAKVRQVLQMIKVLD